MSNLRYSSLFLLSVVNYRVPAPLMHVSVPDAKPAVSQQNLFARRGAGRVVVLFLLTVVTALSFNNFLNLPPVIGMLIGPG